MLGQGPQAAGFLLQAGRRHRLVHVAAQQQDGGGDDRAESEGNAPGPGLDIGLGESLLDHDQHQQRAQLAAHQGDVLERSVEAALLGHGHFAEIGRRRAVLAAGREALGQPRDQQQQRRRRADLGIGRQSRDDQRARAHQQHRNHHRRASALAVGVAAEEPPAQRPDQEADGVDARHVQQLGRAVALREEQRREVQRHEGIDVEVVPLDQIAGRAGHDGADALAVGQVLAGRFGL